METEEITEYIRKAFEYKEIKNYKKAVDYFYKALTMDNNSSEIMCELAFLYEKLKKPDRAIEYLEQALTKKGDDTRIKFKLAEVLRNNGNYRRAEKILRELSSDFIDETEYFAQYIYVLLLQGEFDRIIDEWKNYGGDKNNNSNLLYYMGLTYENLNNFEQSEEFYRRALDKDGRNFEAGFRYASMLYDNKKYEESEEILTELLKEQPNGYIYYLLGEINFIRNNLDDAIRYLSSACRADSKNPTYFYELATSYSLKGFLREAEQNYLEAIKLDPNNLSYNFSLAYLYYTNKEPSKTSRVLDYILSINPQQPNALTLKAQLKLDEKDIVSADKLIKQSLELNPNSDYSNFISSKIFASLGWWEKAIAAIKKAMEYNPASLEYKMECTKYMLNCSMLDEAIEITNKIIGDNPNLIDGLLLKTEALIRKQLFSEADKVIAKILKLDNNSSRAHYFKSEIYKSDKKYQKAINELSLALEQEPGNVRYFESTADCYYKTGDWESAYKFYKEAANLDITQAKYRYMMAKASVLREDKLNAASNFILAKRLEPANLSIILDYFNFLCNENKTKEAIMLLKESKQYLINENEVKTVNTLIEKAEPNKKNKLFNLF
ncbi:tetratricopeptide repeat protein [bacterium]|nr:tetratricopeptide repeat protein [bacterium]